MQTPRRPAAGRERPSWRPFLAVAVLLALLWYLRYEAMLLFGAVLIAATLRALADPLARTAKISLRIALFIVLLALLALPTLAAWWIGEPLWAQIQLLSSELPRAWAALLAWLRESTAGAWLLEQSGDVSAVAVPWRGIAGVAQGTMQALAALVLVVLMGLYLAFDVGLYKRGIVRLFALQHRPRIDAALDHSGHALSRWLLGQGLIMLIVGVLVAGGLAVLGMPLALALGLIAGLLEFIPFFGPIASGLLAVLVAFVQGPQAALYVALLFVVIQQIESSLLVPLIQRWAVHLPPVMAVGAVIVFGGLFGLPGVVFGTPLMVIAMVLVRELYIEQTLEQDRQ